MNFATPYKKFNFIQYFY